MLSKKGRTRDTQSNSRDPRDIVLSEGSQTPRSLCETLERTNPIWSKGAVVWRPGRGLAKRGHEGPFLGDVLFRWRRHGCKDLLKLIQVCL